MAGSHSWGRYYYAPFIRHTSTYFNPNPVLKTTTRFCGLIQPVSASIFAATTATAPQEQQKMPVVSDLIDFPLQKDLKV